mgnify:CR=1 FL=1|jgi:hypothetical protein|tara:strand:- start:2136 stop:2687 length:552 start_codon:yes stop_codon:yes gene_type:complete
MTKEEIFIRKALTKVYPQLVINAKKVCSYSFDKYGYDLIAVCVEFFLRKPIEAQLTTIENNKLENFITFMMAIQLKSSSSKFYREYRQHHLKQRELYDISYEKYGFSSVTNDAFEDEPNELIECIKAQMETLDPYSKMLINERVILESSYTDISKKYNINYASLKRDTDKALTEIRELCQQYT